LGAEEVIGLQSRRRDWEVTGDREAKASPCADEG